MKLIALILVAALAGCASQHRPPYSAVTNFNPDCANRDARIRMLTKWKRFPLDPNSTVTQSEYDRTIDVQIERLKHYCQ